jgi:hypothetical protein
LHWQYKMTAFLKKYKWTIIYWIIILFFLLYFTPRQTKYYLNQDIEQFKTLYLIPTLIWIFGLLAAGLFVFWLIKTKSVGRSLLWFLSTTLTFAFIIFIFQDIFLGGVLFLNRQFKTGQIQKAYEVHYFADTDNALNNFIPYDIATKQSIVFDRKLQNALYQDGLKQNDTVRLQLEKGLFGIAFKTKPFNDK